MVSSSAIGDPNILQKPVNDSGKLKNVKPVVDTGMTIELSKYIKNGPTVKSQPGENFKRVSAAKVAEFLHFKRNELIEERLPEEQRTEFAKPMDEFLGVKSRPAVEFMILDVRSIDEYNTCHIAGAVHYNPMRLNHATLPFSNDIYAFRNKPGRMIVIYDLEEEVVLGKRVANFMFEKGIENLAILAGGLREFVQEHSAFLVGESPVPIDTEAMKMRERIAELSHARSEARSVASRKPKMTPMDVMRRRRSVSRSRAFFP